MATNHGPVRWGRAERSEDGHRTLSIIFLVEGDVGSSASLANTDGPQKVTFADNLPNVGDSWQFGNDDDDWAFCTPFLGITPVVRDGEKNKFWELEYRFSTKPWVDRGGLGGLSGIANSARLSWCAGVQIENPLLIPHTIRGSFVSKVTRSTEQWEGTTKSDTPIQTTSFEPVEVDRDENLPQVQIGKNVLNLDLPDFSNLVNTINDAPMWGMPERTIKLSNVTWERRMYGLCTFYWHRTFIFDVNPNTFDRDDIPNYGKKAIDGTWEPDAFGNTFEFVPFALADPTNPKDFIEFRDRKGNLTETWLDPATGEPTDTVNFIKLNNNPIQVYKEGNLLSLGVPAVIG